MIVYLFFHGNQYPSGGVKVLFHIASTLKKLGFESKMMIPKDKFNVEIKWFDSENIEIVNNYDLITSDDIVILPEETLWVFHELVRSKGCQYILTNQGAHWSLTNYLGIEYTQKIYQNSLGIFVNSEHTKQLVTRLFGKLDLYRFVVPIQGDFNPYTEKENIICYMRRRNNETAECVAQYAAGVYKNWQVISIHDVPHNNVIDLMNRAKIFLSFGGPEGFGMPPVEAALAGCKIIGYHGYGGLEYFTEPLFTPLPLMEITSFIDQLDIYTTLLEDKNPLDIKGSKEQMETLKEKYSLEKFRSDIVTSFSKMILQNKIQNW